MPNLGDISKIEKNISSSSLKAVKALHVVAFGNEGESRKTRKALRTFSGFKLDKKSSEYAQKVSDVKQKVQLPDLIAVCNILDLDYTGSDDEVVERICSFMNDLQSRSENEFEDEEVEEEESEKELDSDDENGNHGGTKSGKSIRETKSKSSFSLSFRDVEDSIRPFDGKDNYPVRKWIEDFEEISELTGWNELQKLIFAKKSLTGLAKLFIQSENGITKWTILKKKLIAEFEVKVSSAQIHKLLMAKKKRREEPVQEYVLKMREIGSRANIETEALIQYIIDGIQDDTSNKIILYGARSFAEFKEKVKLYEQIAAVKPQFQRPERNQDSTHRKNWKKETKNGKDEKKHKKSTIGLCYNCGLKGHLSNECPDKARGPKCFVCSGYGHVSTKCPEKNKGSGSSTMTIMEVVPKNSVKFIIEGVQLIALLDTGSDITAIRQDVYESHFRNIDLDAEFLTIRGIGSNRIATMGSFEKDVLINEEELTLRVHVISNEASHFKAIVGNDILSQVDVVFRAGEIVISKKETDNFLMNMNLDEEFDRKTETVDVSHIKDEERREQVKKLIEDYEPEKIKLTDVKMKIIMKNEEPVYQRPRRLALPEKQVVEKQIEEWLKEGIIRRSSSDFASPIVLVKKKDGSTRICCDYRKLNKNIVKDRFPLPLIEDVLDRLHDANFFSTIDLRNGFFHVGIEDCSIKYTAFVTHHGQFEFLKCPFGLCNSPAVFQRFISTVFRELMMENIMLYYMDDIIVLSSTEEEGLKRLQRVLQVAKDYGLDLKKKKCQLLQKRIEFLGFIIEDGRVQPSNEKTLAIRNYPQPTTVKQIQSFLGLTGYFRKFIASYSIIAKPLSDLLRKDQQFVFGEKQNEAFERLRKLLSSEPVLHIYNQAGETELHTDASKYGYGACLMQKADEDNKFHPVYYMSKKTTPAEEKYGSYELEVLAIIQAVKKFRIYLLGIQFKIVTDCSAFQKTMAKKDLTTRVARWALLLEEYSYVVEHRKGNRMSHVDALSRYPVVMTMTNTLMEEAGVIERLKRAQEADEHILAVKKILSTEDYEDFFIKNGILYKFENGRELIVAPKAMQTEIIKRSHEIGHFAVPKTEEMVKREFYIPKLKEKIQRCIGNCISCILGSRKEGKKEGMLHPIPKQDGPLHTYHVDHLGPMSSTNKNYRYIFAIVDDFSKFTWLYACKSTTAKEVISCFEKQKQVFGNPARIISDRGTAFTAEEFEAYCALESIQHVRITTGVPRGNGQIERVNRIIIPVLTKLSLEDPTKWFKYVERVQRALNSTIQRSIGATPFEILTGVKMRNKEDILIKELLEDATIKKFNESREELREESKRQILKVQEENRRAYNLRRRNPKSYKVGDLVAIKRTQFGSGIKIHKKYLGPYEIVKVSANERYDVMKVGCHEGPIRTTSCAEFMKPWIDNQSESESDSLSDGRM